MTSPDMKDNIEQEILDASQVLYSMKLNESTGNLEEIILKYQKQFKVDGSEFDLLRGSSNDENSIYITSQNEEQFDNLANLLKSSGINYQLVESETELNSQLPGNIYIRGLLPTTTSEDLYNIFKPFGDIQSCKIIYDDFGISKGYGFINYSNKNQANEAIQNLNDVNVDGNNLFINHHVSKKDRLKELEFKKSNYTNLYIKNFPEDISKEKLLDIFGKFGEIESVFLPHDKENGNFNKGYGFINFKYHDDAMNALEEMNDFEIEQGYNIQLGRAERKRERVQYQNLSNNNNFSITYVPYHLQQLSPPPLQSQSIDSQTTTTETSSSSSSHSNVMLIPPPPQQPQSSQPMMIPQQRQQLDETIPPFIISPDSNLIATATGLPIAGPQYQDSNLYVTHLPLNMTDDDLFSLFSQFGNIASAKIMTYQKNELNSKTNEGEDENDEGKKKNESDNDSEEGKEEDGDTIVKEEGKSKGFGFVCFSKPIDASKALVAMNGYQLDDTHILSVTFAQRKEIKYEKGKMHHYNQNHLGGFYNYLHHNFNKRRVTYPPNTQIANMPLPQYIPPSKLSQQQQPHHMQYVQYNPYVYYQYPPSGPPPPQQQQQQQQPGAYASPYQRPQMLYNPQQPQQPVMANGMYPSGSFAGVGSQQVQQGAMYYGHPMGPGQPN